MSDSNPDMASVEPYYDINITFHRKQKLLYYKNNHILSLCGVCVYKNIYANYMTTVHSFKHS